jgi:hypothetical protein
MASSINASLAALLKGATTGTTSTSTSSSWFPSTSSTSTSTSSSWFPYTTSVSSVTSGIKSFDWSWFIVGVLAAISAAVLVYYTNTYGKTRPLEGDNFKGSTTEAFYGGAAVGTGQPFCSEMSAEAAQLYATFNGRLKAPGVDSGSDDFREFAQLLGKLACLKKDLLSPSGIVEATRYPDYATTSDLEPVQETAARCLAKTIPTRDLDLSFDKWKKRGTELLLRLCTTANLTEQEVRGAEERFNKLWADVYDIAQGQCLNSQITAKIAGQDQPREPSPYMPSSDDTTYKGFSTGIF